MTIRIIGKGCYFCRTMHKICDELVKEMALTDAHIEQVDDMDEMLEFGVVNPPALIVNGKLKLMGRVLVKSRIKRAIEEEISSPSPP
jgi:small redox-active disulfide protein 2